jgi:dolichol kinase
VRLHRGGRFRTWLGARLGGDFELGDRAWRRIIHSLGAAVLIYYPLPNDFFLVLPKAYVLLLALAVVVVLEVLRHWVALELPTIRPYETDRVGSFAFFAVAIVAAILLFPMPIAAAVILGTSLVDPLAGELRRSVRYRKLDPALPFAAYAGLALVGLVALGQWPLLGSVGLALVAAAIAVAVEGPRFKWVDDDLAMILGPAVALYVLGVLIGRY